jgi:predicted RNA-binding protein with TRAM domain
MLQSSPSTTIYTGTYRDVTVESIRRSGDGVEVEIYDHETGDYQVLEMEE